jgi:hypothetical protein
MRRCLPSFHIHVQASRQCVMSQRESLSAGLHARAHGSKSEWVHMPWRFIWWRRRTQRGERTAAATPPPPRVEAARPAPTGRAAHSVEAKADGVTAGELELRGGGSYGFGHWAPFFSRTGGWRYIRPAVQQRAALCRPVAPSRQWHWPGLITPTSGAAHHAHRGTGAPLEKNGPFCWAAGGC